MPRSKRCEASECRSDPTGGPQHAGAREGGRLEEHVRCGRPHLGDLTTHHAAERDRTLQIADQQIVRRADAVHPVERPDHLAVGGRAHDDAGSGQSMQIEPVERLPELEHRVVRRVDDRVDRPHPAGDEPRLGLQRRGSRGDAAEHPRHVAETALGRVDPDARDAARALVGLLQGLVHRRQLDARERRDLARDPEDRQEVRTVGLHLDIEDGDVELERSREVRPGLPPLPVQDEDAGVVDTQRQFARGTEHAVRRHPADRPRAEGLVQHRHAGTRRGPRHQIARREVPDADHDFRLAGAVAHARAAELLGVWVVEDLEDACHDDALEPRPRVEEALDLHPALRHALGELVGSHLGRGERAEPRERHPHEAAPH